MKKPLIVQKVEEYLTKNSVDRLSRETGLYDWMIVSFLENKHTAQNEHTLRRLYKFFNLEVDQYYIDNIYAHPRVKRHEGIVGEVLRYYRIKAGFSVQEVSRKVRLSEKTIERLERSVQVPSKNSYTLQKILDFYKISQKEKDAINNIFTGIRTLSLALSKNKKTNDLTGRAKLP